MHAACGARNTITTSKRQSQGLDIQTQYKQNTNQLRNNALVNTTVKPADGRGRLSTSCKQTTNIHPDEQFLAKTLEHRSFNHRLQQQQPRLHRRRHHRWQQGPALLPARAAPPAAAAACGMPGGSVDCHCSLELAPHSTPRVHGAGAGLLHLPRQGPAREWV